MQKNLLNAKPVILLADDLGYGELGCQGNQEIPTPHIDSIGEKGVRFTQGYVTAPNCSPSRAGLLTGKYGTASVMNSTPQVPKMKKLVRTSTFSKNNG